MNYATQKRIIKTPEPDAEFPSEKLKDVNAALDIFAMFFANVNTIDDDNILKIVTHLRRAGRADLADALVLSRMAAGLRGEG